MVVCFPECEVGWERVGPQLIICLSREVNWTLGGAWRWVNRHNSSTINHFQVGSSERARERATVNQTVWQSLLVCSEAEKHGNKQVRLTPSGRSYCSTRARPCGLTGHQIPVFLFDPITRAWWACLSPRRLQQSDAPNHSFRQVSRGIIYFSRHPRSACHGDGASLTCRRSTETLHCCFRRHTRPKMTRDCDLERQSIGGKKSYVKSLCYWRFNEVGPHLLSSEVCIWLSTPKIPP